MTSPASSPDRYSQQTQLAVRMNMALMRLYRLEREVAELRREIAEFLEEYFGAIAAKLHPGLYASETISEAEEALPSDEMTDVRRHLDALDEQMHHMYRQLARQCHPDVNRNVPEGTMRAVNEAYQNKELGSLIILCADMLDGAMDQEALEQQYQMIAEMETMLQKERETLDQSDANRLRKRHLLSRLHGDDFVESVAGGINQMWLKREEN